jgi:hypothetical protein
LKAIGVSSAERRSASPDAHIKRLSARFEVSPPSSSDSTYLPLLQPVQKSVDEDAFYIGNPGLIVEPGGSLLSESYEIAANPKGDGVWFSREGYGGKTSLKTCTSTRRRMSAYELRAD